MAGPRFTKGGGLWHGDQGVLLGRSEFEKIPVEKPTDEDRYQRGFTPDRLREVHQALGRREQFTMGSDGVRRSQAYFGSAYTEGGTYGDNPFSRGDEEHAFQGRTRGVKKAAETIARSTMPLDALKEKPPNVFVKSKTEGSGESKKAAGHYKSGGEGALTNKPAVVLYGHAVDKEQKEEYLQYRRDEGQPPPSKQPKKVMRSSVHSRQGDEQTLIHELGHHHSDVIGTPHSTYSTASERGAEEAYADDFKDKHYRPDPRDVQKGSRWDPRPYHAYDAQHTTPTDPYGESDSDQEKFAASYEANRKHRPQYSTLMERVDAEQEAERNPSTLFVPHPQDRWRAKSNQRLVVNHNLGRQWEES